jgi:DNA-binding PucR family transcriptional regulator
VAPRDAHRSLGWARLVLGLVRRGALPNRLPTRVEDHLGEVILLQDEALAGELVRRALAPLEALPASERERLLETLRAWLDFQRHTPAVAQALQVHPQTVRYRIGKLRDLLTDRLESVDGRFELELALRARRALDNPARAPGV